MNAGLLIQLIGVGLLIAGFAVVFGLPGLLFAGGVGAVVFGTLIELDGEEVSDEGSGPSS